MGNLTWLVWVLAVPGLLLALYGMHRLALWLEERGWLYYRKQSGGGTAGGWMALQEVIEPSVKHVLEIKHDRRHEDAEAARERLLARLLVCLDSTPANRDEIRLCLAAARCSGLDWRQLYEEAVGVQRLARPDLANLFPSVQDVAPPS